MMLISIAAVIVGYLLGSIPMAFIVARWHGIPDLRQVGSGNLGATNVWRQVGARAALLVLAADVGKGALAVAVARWISSLSSSPWPVEYVAVAAGLSAVLGHVYTVWLGFRGGKGVATALGMMICVLPLPTLIAIAAFAVVVVVTKIVSVGSILGAMALFAATVWLNVASETPGSDLDFWLALVLLLLVLWTHRQNMARILRGTESKMSFASRRGRTDDE